MRRASVFLQFALVFSLACAGTPVVTTVAPPVPSLVQPPAAPATAAPEPTRDELDAALPVDARVRVGKLANGLTYFILPHKKPEKRAQLWLAVNAGAVQEDDDQRGLAHFVEHMGFNGTKNYPKQELVNFLEGIGMKFGPDLNAYTSFDETVYMLQVPTDKAELIDKGLDVLREWAGSLTFDPAEVEKERGVVMEEWRLGRGAGMRIFDKQAPVLFHQSKYAERLPIGKPEIIKGASRDTVMRFYRDWYRPDLMAVIAVGDFAPDELEKRIKAEFAALQNPAKPRPRTMVAMPSHQKTLISIETDPEMPSTSVSIFDKLPHRSEASARDYRRMVGEQLYHSMLNARLDEIRRKPDAPFLGAGSGTSKFVRSTDIFAQSAAVKEDGVLRAVEALLEEGLRVEQHGFTQTELDRATKALVRQYRQAVAERDKQDGRQFASEIVRHFLQGEAMPGIEAEMALVERFLPTYTLAELNGLAKSWGSTGSEVVAVSGPDKMKKPTEQAIAQVVGSVKSRTVTAYNDAVASVPLLASAPKAGSITATRTVPEIGVLEWKLSNGARVVVKATDFKNDEVRVSAFSPGGHSLVKDADFDSAQFADNVVSEAGIGPFDAVQLQKALSGKIVSVRPDIGELQEGLAGSASPEDLETLLQLIYLQFTGARRDEASFQAWKAREIEQVKNRRLSPEMSFFEDLTTFAYQNHRRRQPITPEVVQKVDLDKALAIYKDRFADAGDFTFVFVGNVAPDRLKPLVATYIASLPTKKRKERWRDVGLNLVPGVKTKVIQKGREPKSYVVMVFHGLEKWSRDAENDMKTLADVLNIRLREVLREDMGGVYGVSASGVITRRPRQKYSMNIHFGCSPDNVDKLEKAVFDEIKVIQDKGIGEDYLRKVRETRVRQHELSLKENGFWERELAHAWDYGDDPKKIPDIKPMVEKITSDRVRAAAKKYLRSKEYVLGVLKPEGQPTAAFTK